MQLALVVPPLPGVLAVQDGQTAEGARQILSICQAREVQQYRTQDTKIFRVAESLGRSSRRDFSGPGAALV
jgi:hypothetical protein